MQIHKEFILRYSSDGHLRFEVPSRVCDKRVAEKIIARILLIQGVYRAKIFNKQCKLSIFFQEHYCDFDALTQQLFKLIEEMEVNGELTPQHLPNESTKNPEKKWVRWLRKRFLDTQESMQQGNSASKFVSSKANVFFQNPEKEIIDFLNDILVLFLIKLHWQDITQKWLVSPIRYRYEWIALFYMFFLLIRSRKSK